MTNERPLILINFSVAADAEPEFTRFYHQQFLPRLKQESPEIFNIRRYEEFGMPATLRWYNKQFLTIYQLNDVEDIPAAHAIFERAAVHDLVMQFRSWKEKSLHNFSRITFKPTWSHARNGKGEAFVSCPFFLWQLEMDTESDNDFQHWYERDYLPLQMAEIPVWHSCRRYESIDREPCRRLTFFEAANEENLFRCMELLRAPSRNEQNYEWQRRVTPAVRWQDATIFRPIYRWPD